MGVVRTMMEEDMGSNPMLLPGTPLMTLGKYHSNNRQLPSAASHNFLVCANETEKLSVATRRL